LFKRWDRQQKKNVKVMAIFKWEILLNIEKKNEKLAIKSFERKDNWLIKSTFLPHYGKSQNTKPVFRVATL
jgi:hypothetical protein